MSTVADAAPRPRSWLRTLWRWSFFTFATVVVAAAVVVGLFRILVPMVPGFHERIETAAGEALGVPVTVESLDVRWRLHGPELVFEGVRVLDGESDNALLEAAGGHVNLNVAEFLATRRVMPDFVVLRGLDIAVFRNDDGEFSVLGRPARRGEAASLSDATSWPLPDGLYVLQDSRVRYTAASADPVVVEAVSVNVEVGGRRLRLDGELRPPAGMGDALEISAELDRTTDSLSGLSWQVYVAGSNLQLSGVNRVAGASVVPLSSGTGTLTAWAEFDGLSVRRASLDLEASAVQFARGGAPYDDIRGRFELDRSPLGLQITARDLALERSGFSWPDMTASFLIEQGGSGEPTYRITLPFARLDDLWPLAELLPQGRLRESLIGFRPSGNLYDVSVVLDASAPPARGLTAEGRFERLGWTANKRIPGARGLSGRVRTTPSGGALAIESDQVELDAPNLFDRRMPVRRVAATLNWSEQDGHWKVDSENVLLATTYFDALANVSLTLPPKGSPRLDLDAQLGDFDISRGLDYLPVGVMKPKLVEWLSTALQGGTIREGEVAFHGALDQFPFDGPDSEGEFSARLSVEDLVMAYSPGWPSVTNVTSDVRFGGRGLTAMVQSARFGNARATKADVTIEDFRNTVVEVNVETRAPLEVVRDYLVTTPLNDRYGVLLNDLKPSGPASSTLRVTVPVKKPKSTDYRVEVKAEGATLAYRDWPIDLEDIRGSVIFRRDGITSPAATGVLLSRPVALAMDMAPLQLDGQAMRQMRVRASGRTDANVLADRVHPPLAGIFSGLADWQATIAFPPATQQDVIPTTVEITSGLEGLAIDLPVPLQKPVDDRLAVKAILDVYKSAPMRAAIELGGELKADVSVDVANQWAVQRAAVVMGEGDARIDERPGVTLRGRIDELDVDGWMDLFKGRNAPSDNGLRTADVRFERAQVLGQPLTAGRLQVDRNAREWLVEVEAEEVSGAIFLPRDNAAFEEPVIANLQTLRWQTGSDRNGGVDPRTLPALRLDVQDFWYEDMNFGQLAAQVSRVEDGLRIERADTTGDGFKGRATGVWRYAAGRPSELMVTFQSTDVRSTMVALGSAGAIESDEATFAMDLHWDDELDAGFLNDVYGQVSIAVSEGNLLTVDPKAGRVFGLLSLAALPRRLGLDFRDMFQKGFAFDAIEGNFSVRNGSAFTDNLTLRGPAAQVAVVGRSGIAAQDYDQTASVYANFGSSLPIAGALAGGPAVGAALLIFSEVFKDPLKEIGRVDYRITGSWDEPEIVRLNAATAGEPLNDPINDNGADEDIAPQADPLPPGG